MGMIAGQMTTIHLFIMHTIRHLFYVGSAQLFPRNWKLAAVLNEVLPLELLIFNTF
jgi:hypothetical protein